MKRDELDFLEQALKHLDGTLPPDEARAVDEAIARDPARARRYAALAMQRVQLAEMGRARPLPLPARRRRMWMVIPAAAAVGAIVALVVIRGDRAEQRRQAAAQARPRVPTVAVVPSDTGAEGEPELAPLTVDAVQGAVTVAREEVAAPARAGRVLAAGDALAVGDGAHATVRADGVRLEVAAATTAGPVAPLRLETAAPGVALPVAHGHVHLDRRPHARATIALVTPLGEVRASGPVRLRVDVRPADTRVEVFEGAVTLASFADGRKLDLAAGALATLAVDREPVVEKLEPPAPVAFGLQASPRELPVLRRVPPKLLAKLRGWTIRENGMVVGGNDEGFTCSGSQRQALGRMVVGAALENRALVDEAWAVIDTTMKFQAPDGSFLDRPICDADWLADLSHALVVLMESPLERAYRARIKALLPQLALTAHYVAQPAIRDQVTGNDGRSGRRLLSQSVGFIYAGLLLDDRKLEALGRHYLDRGLEHQRKDGSFVIHDGHDSIYQAINLEYLGWLSARLGDARVEAARRHGAEWLLTRITPAAEWDLRGNTATEGGRCTRDCVGPDWMRLAWVLVHHGVDRDPALLELAGRMLTRGRAVRE